MMNINTLTPKVLRIAVKEKKTLDSLASEYECSVETLVLQIQRVSQNKNFQREVISGLKRNEKFQRRISSKQTTPDVTAGSDKPVNDDKMIGDSEVSNVVCTDVQCLVDDNSSVSNNDEQPVCETKHLSQDELLASLKTQQAQLSQEVIYWENQHKKLVSEHRSLKNELEQLARTLDELKRLFVVNRDKVNGIIENCAAVTLQMEEVTFQKNLSAEKLRGVRSKLTEMQKVLVFVFSDGVELENAADPLNLSEDLLNKKMVELVQVPQALKLNMSMTEIHSIAQLSFIIEQLNSSKIPFEVSFDSEKLAKFYEAIK